MELQKSLNKMYEAGYRAGLEMAIFIITRKDDYKNAVATIEDLMKKSEARSEAENK